MQAMPVLHPEYFLIYSGCQGVGYLHGQAGSESSKAMFRGHQWKLQVHAGYASATDCIFTNGWLPPGRELAPSRPVRALVLWKLAVGSSLLLL